MHVLFSFDQLCLCCALYIALNLGHPQTLLNTNATQHYNDIYFISVNGGFRTFNQQLHLLNMVCFHFQPILFVLLELTFSCLGKKT